MTDAQLAAELFAIAVETNCETEGMKAANITDRLANMPPRFGHSAFMKVLARHEARIETAKRAAIARRQPSCVSCGVPEEGYDHYPHCVTRRDAQ